jgi:hypothetical protein
MYNIWETCILKLHFALDFWLYILNIFYMLSCYKLVLQWTHRLCPPRSVLHYADCLLCRVHDYSIQLQLVLVIGSYTLHISH